MIRSVERALAIFEAFEPNHTMLSLQEIGKRIKLSKATTYRLVNCLYELGYLVRLDDSRYCLSLKVTRLSGVVHSTIGIREIARPVMLELVRTTGETVTLNTVVDGQRLCVEVFDTPSPLMSIVRPGEQTPLLKGATGKMLLAHLPKKEVDRIWRDTPPRERPNRAALDRDLAKYREQGYAHTSGERVFGVTAVSAPIYNIDGGVKYSISVTGPAVRVDLHVRKFAEFLFEATRSITNRLGGRDPSASGQNAECQAPKNRRRAA
ncbi:IclR family transcriptional regulator [Pseudorhodoplanes sp.]|uniref:IclR family transcriptional regulator n=1 Tax=Pseudorhodoplanes sp. TaxID=1934341 RepID=UPI003D12ADC2